MTGEPRPSVLLLGIDRYVLRACVRNDVSAVVVCSHGVWDKGLVRIPAGTTVLRVDDQSNPESVLAALHRAGLGRHRFDGIQTTDEWALVTASLLGQAMGVPSLRPETAVYLRDKSLQKARVRAAGLLAARAEVVEDIHDAGARDGLGFPAAVLKPIAGAGTRRTCVVADIAALREQARRHRLQGGRQRTFLLEELISGEEWVADGVAWGGEVAFYGLGRYAQTCLTMLDRQIPLVMYRFDPDGDAAVYQAADPVVRGAAAALGLTGVFHMELFHDAATGRVIFSECAGRRGGGLIHEEIEYKFGVDLGEAALITAIGARPALKPRTAERTVGCAYLPGRPGTLIRCPLAADLMAQPDVEFARVHPPFGTRLTGVTGSTSDRLAEVLITGASASAVTRRASELVAWFGERLVVAPDGASARELRRWQAATWPDSPGGDLLYGGDTRC